MPTSRAGNISRSRRARHHPLAWLSAGTEDLGAARWRRRAAARVEPQLGQVALTANDLQYPFGLIGPFTVLHVPHSPAPAG